MTDPATVFFFLCQDPLCFLRITRTEVDCNSFFRKPQQEGRVGRFELETTFVCKPRAPAVNRRKGERSVESLHAGNACS